MRVVLAPDKFKGSLTAAEVADALATGLRDEHGGIEVSCVPVADGGEGTVEAALANGFAPRSVQVSGPLGDPVQAQYAVRDGCAVIEMALASGLGVLPVRNGEPVLDGARATSRGTGQLIADALDAGAREIVLGVGGSANTDGGAGMLEALGLRLLDSAGRPVPPGVAGLARLARVDAAGLDPRLSTVRLTLASDVDNPLTGPQGAAVVFGPQKGLDAAQVEQADAALLRYRDLLATALGSRVRRAADAPGAGAAGGVGFAALVLGAERRAGIDVVLELVGLAQRLDGADLVVTGEGSLDEQSLMGKTPVGVLRLAQQAHVPTVVVCGRLQLTEAQVREAGFAAVHTLAELEPDPARSMSHAAELLRTVGRKIATSTATGTAHA